MLEEGITEAGAFSAWLALATLRKLQPSNDSNIPLFILCLVFKEFMI